MHIATDEIRAQIGLSIWLMLHGYFSYTTQKLLLFKKKRVDLSNPKILTESNQYFQIFPHVIIDSLDKAYKHEWRESESK